MDLSKLGEPLKISQVDFRVQSINGGGYATILAYKDARVDMDRLDEVVGRGKWQRKHEIIGNQLFCSVGIYNEDIKEWIWVQDVGTESNTEKEKGRASDSFKRACFNLGIGRELYEYPQISIKLNTDEYEDDPKNQGKKRATWNFKLKEWRWYAEFEGTKVSYLACKDGKGVVRYTHGTRRTVDGTGSK